MKIKTTYITDFEYTTSNEIGNEVKIDMRPDDLKEHQSPTELLLSALTGCVAVDIMIMLKKRKKSISQFVIEAEGERANDPPRRYTNIHLHYILTSPDANETELEKTAKLALEKYCSVAASLNSEITSSQEIIRP